MNLARVEYYFADFLSVLESKRFNDNNEALNNFYFKEFIKSLTGTENLTDNNYKFTSQSIKLHNENDLDIPKEIFLPPNLYFVGSVNIDETTHMFSPKVLDRAFTIEFDVGDFEEYLKFLENRKDIAGVEGSIKEEIKKDFINDGEFATIDKNKIKEFLNGKDEIVKSLNEINKTLKKYNLHFGYRVFDEIVMFLYHAENSSMDTEEALDLAIKMKVLPKFNGTRQKLEKPILEFLKLLDLKEEKIEELIKDGIPELDELKNITKKHTAHKLLEMLYKLRTQGFASFI